ncbi:7347_t:CDS:2 [Cetraspora pellucida]|uniref:7347_t:CDS:1 n=1 Tax=Cetraspora pellucida TaxID=1433469 RepID=A0A9N9F6Z1_9GLOM|nr:7347_t:CDS:2 [Cetraspora pellucida]
MALNYSNCLENDNKVGDSTFDAKKLRNPEDLCRLKNLIDNYKLSENELNEGLKSLCNFSSFNCYDETTIMHLRLHLQTCVAILHLVICLTIPLDDGIWDEFFNSLDDFAKVYNEEIKQNFDNLQIYYENSNIQYLLTYLQVTLKLLKSSNSIDIKTTLDKILNTNTTYKKLKKGESTKFDQPNSWCQILRELLLLNYSLNYNVMYKTLQYHKEDYLFEFIWQYSNLSIQHITEVKLDISEISNDPKDFIDFIGIMYKREPAAQSKMLLFETLQKSKCTHIWFKSVELLLSLSSKEPELFHEIVQDRINKFNNTLTNTQEFNGIISCVIRKLELEDKFFKLDLTKIEKNFDQKLTAEEGIGLLIEIIFDRISCPITKNLVGDFFVLICGHSISHRFKNKCPFCKVNIESEPMYYLSRNAILEGLCEFLSQAGYIYSEGTNSLKLTQKTHSKAMLFAFEKAGIAEKKQEYSIAIMWLTRVLHFYSKSYSIQCRRAAAFINLNRHLEATNDLTIAIRLKPSKCLAYIYRSSVYIAYKNYDNALHDINEALRIDPNNEYARLEKEKICEYKKQTGNIDRPIINFMQLGLSDEILINIFKFIRFPLNLILTCKSWYNISGDHMVRAEWIVYQYGRAHALFYAIRFGPNFINLYVAKAIVTNGAIISSYFIQRLLLHFGKADQQLETLKMDHNINNQNMTNVQIIQQQNSKIPWANDWIKPTTENVTDRIKELIKIGFELSYTIIGDIMQLFEKRLAIIGNTLIEAFVEAKNDTKENLLFQCVIEALKPNRKLKGIEVFEFLYQEIDDDKEKLFSNAMDILKDMTNNRILDGNDNSFKPLESSTMYYNWCLKKFGENAKITERCFEIILITRISIDNYYKQNQTQTGLMQDKFKNECEIFKIYCNARNFFKPSHLQIISKATHDDILKTLFEYYLAILFDIQTLYTLPSTDNLDTNVKIPVYTIEKNKIYQFQDESLFENRAEKIEAYKVEWFNELENSFNKIFNQNDLKGTNEFRNYLKRFWEEYNKKNPEC